MTTSVLTTVAARIKARIRTSYGPAIDRLRADLRLAGSTLVRLLLIVAVAVLLAGAAAFAALYGSFFFFEFMAETLSTWMPSWAATLLVSVGFLLVAATMLAGTVFAAIRGLRTARSLARIARRRTGRVPGDASAGFRTSALTTP